MGLKLLKIKVRRLLYSFLSLLKNKDNLLQQYPSSFQIEITHKCNLKCIMCAHTRLKNEIQKYKDDDEYFNTEMSLSEFKNIIDRIPTAKTICMSGLGENFLNKDFLEMVKYAKSKKIFVISFSNCLFLNKKTGIEFINTGIDSIFISIDGATKETYEKIRIGSDFGRVINNVKNLIRMKKEKGENYPLINFCYTVNKYNSEEIIKFIKLASELTEGEKTTIIFKRTLDPTDKNLYLEIPKAKIQQANGEAKKLRIQLSWENIPQVKSPTSGCSRWLMPFISVSGEVSQCCFSAPPVENYYKLGNMFEQNFKEIWNSKKYKEFRTMLKKDKPHQFCKNCLCYNNDIKIV